MKSTTITFLILFFVGVLSSAQDTIQVPADQPTIQDGIDAADDGDVVLVAEGTYYENIYFDGKAIWVASHYLIDEDPAHILNTIIDGSDPQNPNYNSVVNFVDGEDTTSVLCGFTVQNGTGSTTPAGNIGGGGIYVLWSGARIIHNRIINNQVQSNGGLPLGGGLAAGSSNDDLLVLRYNYFSGNQLWAPESPPTGCYGGGAWLYGMNCLVSHNEFIDNYVEGWAQGGGLSTEECSGIISHNLFDGNSLYLNTTGNGNAGGYGGGLYVLYPKTGLTVSRNTIINNECTGISSLLGGGMAVNNRAELEGDVLIEGNRISNNKAKRGGGITLALDYPGCTLRNNIIDSNHATEYGGAILLFYNTNKKQSNNPVAAEIPASSTHRPTKSTALPIIVNNTFAYNTAESYYGAIVNVHDQTDVVIFNNIFHGNYAPECSDLLTDAGDYKSYLYNNNIDTDSIYGEWEGEDNIFEEDPGFYLDTYHLMASSPCKDEGTDDVSIDDNFYYAPEIDFDGEARPYDGDIDMGADEWYPYTSVNHSFATIETPIRIFPNPAISFVTAKFDLPKAGEVELSIHDLDGRKVAMIKKGHFSKGSHQVQLDATRLKPGIYFCTLKTNNGTSTQKIVKL